MSDGTNREGGTSFEEYVAKNGSDRVSKQPNDDPQILMHHVSNSLVVAVVMLQECSKLTVSTFLSVIRFLMARRRLVEAAEADVSIPPHVIRVDSRRKARWIVMWTRVVRLVLPS